jgi:PKD repeat protein
MRTKTTLICACFFLIMGVIAYSNMPGEIGRGLFDFETSPNGGDTSPASISGLNQSSSLMSFSDQSNPLNGSQDGRDGWVIKVDAEGNQLWTQAYGDGDDGRNELYEVIQLADNSLVFVGSKTTNDTGKHDAWLIKANETGQIQWEKTLGDSEDDRAYDLVQTTDGGFVLGGYTSSDAGDKDMWLVRTNPDGDIIWNQTYGGQHDESIRCLIQTSDGGFALIGYTHSSGEGGSDVWLVKTDPNGEVQWTQTYGGENDEKAYSGIQTTQGEYVLAGYTETYGSGKSDVWLIKTDENGSLQWERTFGREENDYAYDLINTSDGFAIAGQKTGYDFFANLFVNYWWLIKTDNNGNIDWTQTYYGDPYHYGPTGDAAYALIQTPDEGFAITGQRGAFEEGFDADTWIIKTNEIGAPEWDQPPHTDYPNTARFIIQASDGGYIYGGFKNLEPAPRPPRPLKADFTATPETGTEPLEVHFNDQSGPPDSIVSWFWDFGDGSTSTEQNPSHTYTRDGGYEVILLVSGSDGDQDTSSSQILVSDSEPRVNFTATPSRGIEPLQVAFEDHSIYYDDIYYWWWEFGDGSSSSQQNPNHIYIQDGIFTATLIVMDIDGSQQERSVKIVVEDSSPVADFSASDREGKSPHGVVFADRSLSYDGIVVMIWDFGDGSGSYDRNPYHVYTSDGSYDITLTVKERDADTDTRIKKRYIILPETADIPIMTLFSIFLVTIWRTKWPLTNT